MPEYLVAKSLFIWKFSSLKVIIPLENRIKVEWKEKEKERFGLFDWIM